MTSDEYRALCGRLGISPYRFAELAGARPGSRPGWARDGCADPVPRGVAALARLADGCAGRLTYEELAALLEGEAARLRG